MVTDERTETAAAFVSGRTALMQCDRCGGRFPGPGIRRDGAVYCCDLCARGPTAKHMVRMLPAGAALVGLGLLLGWSVARSRS